MWTWTNTVAIARDLVRECHVTMWMTLPISCSRAAVAEILSFFSVFFCSRKPININQHRSFNAWPQEWRSHDFARDLSYLLFQIRLRNDFFGFSNSFGSRKHVDINQHRSLGAWFLREGHVTLYVTFPITCSRAAIAVIFCVFSVFFYQENILTWTSTVALARDLVREGHVTLPVTFHISCSRADRAVIFLFFRFFGQEKYVTINQHRRISAWPCAWRSVWFCACPFLSLVPEKLEHWFFFRSSVSFMSRRTCGHEPTP